MPRASLAEVSVTESTSDTATMKTHPLADPEDPMDAQLASDLLLGFVGLLALAGLVGTVLGFWSMGRSGYRKD